MPVLRQVTKILVVTLGFTCAVPLAVATPAAALGSWTTRPVPGNGEALADISCYSATQCVGVSLFSREVVTTSDAGASWAVYRPSSVGRFGFTSLKCIAPATCYATAVLGAAPMAGGAVYKSTDGGRSWALAYQKKTPNNPSFRFSDVTCLTTSHCLLTGTDGSAGFILSTTDGGKVWTSTRLPPQLTGGSILGIDCAGARVCFAVQNTTARVYKSNDGGLTWTALAIPANFAPYESNKVTPTGLDAISCGSAQFCVAGGYIGHLDLQGTSQPFKWVTQNGGLTWSYANPFASTGAKTPSAVGQNAISCSSNDDCAMGLFYGYFYSTTDQGLAWTWEDHAPLSDNDVLSVTCLSASHCLVSAMSNFPKKSVFAGMLWTER